MESAPPGVRAAAETLRGVLQRFAAQCAHDAADVDRLRAAAERADLWLRQSLLHVTGSALVIEPRSARVLLRWHARLGCWAQVGGHADPGEIDPWRIALREAVEETGLPDLREWPPERGKMPVQVVIVPVPAHGTEPAHEHADIRYLLATDRPDLAAAESAATPLEWLHVGAALERVQEPNLKELLRRAAKLLD